ncbi:fumarylacetoacetate hydrolase family protein [Ornithinimicrobium pekingense]|uniref:Fumarylacetoacetate hydrolase n=1 Tax=Ornithinimicrobium pekingense TaxID=384677 RepID=A0ABQ2FEG9_9MICO|nr:fumarylacetoacetate hydrolase family protein [Ornithinimicrobium pekingense]GGK79721.1 fumarylacetoacetate hydrolase [Ornithinimicrobium pekingense]
MRIANSGGRALVQHGDSWYDVEQASRGQFPAEPRALVGRLEELAEWIGSASLNGQGAVTPEQLDAPVPDPVQIFAIGLNYRAHAEETGSEIPTYPVVFTKWQTSLAGPTGEVVLPADTVDWEAELVVVIGKEAHQVEADDALSYVAGYMNGQDFSERRLQNVGAKPQFSLAKSYPGFSPTGPWLVTLDELEDPNDLAIRTTLVKGDGETEVAQDSRTSDLIFNVPVLVSELSKVVKLLPGDLIFTGTPSGVGLGRTPKMFLQPGWRVQTEIEGLGAMDNAIR